MTHYGSATASMERGPISKLAKCYILNKSIFHLDESPLKYHYRYEQSFCVLRTSTSVGKHWLLLQLAF